MSVLALTSVLSVLGVGAVVGALATHRFTVKRQREQEAQERNSLLFLVLVEMLGNDVAAFRWWKGNGPRDEAPALRTDVWTEARTRLAYLLPFQKFLPLIRYYHSIPQWASRSGDAVLLGYYREKLRPRTENAVDEVSDVLRKQIPKAFGDEFEEEMERFNERTVMLGQ